METLGKVQLTLICTKCRKPLIISPEMDLDRQNDCYILYGECLDCDLEQLITLDMERFIDLEQTFLHIEGIAPNAEGEQK